MNVERAHRGLHIALGELAFYALLAGGFLWAYVGHFHEPAAVIPYHLGMLLPLLVLPLACRALVWKFMPTGRVARVAATLLIIVPAGVLVAWYVIVLVGLDSWGRVATWPLIRTYVLQTPYLLSVLGYSPWIPVVALSLVAMALAFLVWRYVTPSDWMPLLVRKGSKSGVLAIPMALSLLAILLLALQIQVGSGHAREPLKLSFNGMASAKLQSHVVAGSLVLDAREDDARHAYRPAVAAALERRNLVVIVGDALRSGHMGLYGYARSTTPHLSELSRGRGGFLVRNMRSACAESSCGLMAMAASRPISEIGSSPLTLQEVLRLNGYQVHFILGGDHTNFYGLDRMYGKLDSYFDGSRQSVRYINDDQLVLDRVNQLPQARPDQAVAFQFHLMSTHGLGKRDPSLSPYGPISNYYSWPATSPRRARNAAQARGGVNYYDNGVVCFDSFAKRIIDVLQRKGYLRNALVVVVGDHGEMLGENGYFSHEYGTSEAVLDIPFVGFRFGYSDADFPVHAWSNQIDIAPTLLRELDIPIPGIWKGRPLQEAPVAREYKIQQADDFAIYHVADTGQVLKYQFNVASGAESVTDPAIDPLGSKDLVNEVPVLLLNGWRSQAAASVLNAAHGGD